MNRERHGEKDRSRQTSKETYTEKEKQEREHVSMCGSVAKNL